MISYRKTICTHFEINEPRHMTRSFIYQDQPVHLHSLIKTFVVHFQNHCILQIIWHHQRNWSDRVDIQVDLDIRCSYITQRSLLTGQVANCLRLNRNVGKRTLHPTKTQISLRIRAAWWEYSLSSCVTKTCLYNFDTLKPHMYSKTGVYWGIHFSSAQKQRLWVLIRTASPRRF